MSCQRVCLPLDIQQVDPPTRKTRPQDSVIGKQEELWRVLVFSFKQQRGVLSETEGGVANQAIVHFFNH